MEGRRLVSCNQETDRKPVPYVTIGKALGYPPCCIAAFLMRVANVRELPDEWRKLRGSGYIPCRQCDAEYTVRQLVDNINARRQKCLVPFGVREYVMRNDRSLKPLISEYMENAR